MTQPPTLSEMEEYLQHAAADGTSADSSLHSDLTESTSPTLSEMELHLEHAVGAREFDESKVKRSGGRFAKKADSPAQAGPTKSGAPKQDAGPVRATGRFKGMERHQVLQKKLKQVDKDLGPVKTDMVKDSLWMSNKTKTDIMDKIAKQFPKELKAITKQAADEFKALQKKGPVSEEKRLELTRKANQRYVDFVNKKLSGPNAPTYAKSPSGRYRPQLRVGADGLPKISAVDTKNPDAPVRKFSELRAESSKVLADRAEKIQQIRTRWDDEAPVNEDKSPGEIAFEARLKRIETDRLKIEAERARRLKALDDEDDDDNSWWDTIMKQLGLEHSALTENPSPTLSEMEDFLQHEDALSAPTRDEMRHFLETHGEEAFLEHYGVKGMKWGIRRSEALLNRIRGKSPREAAELTDEFNQRVGGINSDRAGAKALREMKVGSVVVVDTGDGPTVVSKQKDGSFRKITMSADAQGVVRTVGKDPAEMSTREMNDAVKRANAIEAYNKIFNPPENPNAELEARVKAMNLQMEYAKAHAAMNPSRAKKVATFVSDLKPAYDMFVKVDKHFEGDPSDKIREWGAKLFGSTTGSSKGPTAQPKQGGQTPNSQKASKKPKKGKQNPVYVITTLPSGNGPGNPYKRKP